MGAGAVEWLRLQKRVNKPVENTEFRIPAFSDCRYGTNTEKVCIGETVILWLQGGVSREYSSFSFAEF